MTRLGQCVTFMFMSAVLIGLAAAQGFAEIEVVNGMRKTTCGSAWAPDFAVVSESQLQQCLGLAPAHSMLAAVFLLSGIAALLVAVWTAVTAAPQVAGKQGGEEPRA